jgi:hypothetical protein
MESRTVYNHASVCRSRRARFHMIIIDFYWSHGIFTCIIIIPQCVALGDARFQMIYWQK